MIMYPAILLSTLINSSSFSDISLRFPLRWLCLLFYIFLFNVDLFCLFFLSIVVASTSSTILSTGNESKHLCLVFWPREKAFHFSSIKYDISSHLLFLICWEFLLEKNDRFCWVYICFYWIGYMNSFLFCQYAKL